MSNDPSRLTMQRADVLKKLKTEFSNVITITPLLELIVEYSLDLSVFTISLFPQSTAVQGISYSRDVYFVLSRHDGSLNIATVRHVDTTRMSVESFVGANETNVSPASDAMALLHEPLEGLFPTGGLGSGWVCCKTRRIYTTDGHVIRVIGKDTTRHVNVQLPPGISFREDVIMAIRLSCRGTKLHILRCDGSLHTVNVHSGVVEETFDIHGTVWGFDVNARASEVYVLVAYGRLHTFTRDRKGMLKSRPSTVNLNPLDSTVNLNPLDSTSLALWKHIRWTPGNYLIVSKQTRSFHSSYIGCVDDSFRDITSLTCCFYAVDLSASTLSLTHIAGRTDAVRVSKQSDGHIKEEAEFSDCRGMEISVEEQCMLVTQTDRIRKVQLDAFLFLPRPSAVK